jgi:glycosyltransferase involved in cell wall biosynthesis
MKIALIVPGVGGVCRGGHARSIPVLQTFIEHLARRHEVLVIALDQPEQARYTLLGASVVSLGTIAGRGRAGQWVNGFRRFMSVLRHEPAPFDILHAFWAGRHAAWAVAAGRLLRARVVVSIGGGELVWLPDIGYGGAATRFGRFKTRLVLKAADAVTAGSHRSLEPLALISPGAVWLPLGVDRAHFWGSPGRPDGPPWRLLQVASLNPVKDQVTLLRALRSLLNRGMNVELDCVGEDTLAGTVQRDAAALGVAQRIRFHGYLPPEAIRNFYRTAHVFVQSSRFESMGAAVLEAAASGVPTVGTSVGLVAEMAPTSALAVPVRNPEALAEGVGELLRDRERRERLGRAAQEFARTYDADWTASQLENLYARLGRRSNTAEYGETHGG